jgi:hypothetical protein
VFRDQVSDRPNYIYIYVSVRMNGLLNDAGAERAEKRRGKVRLKTQHMGN